MSESDHLPVVEKDLLVMICCLNKAKVVLQSGHEAVQSLGVGGVSVQNSDGDCTLQAGSLHFTDGKLHLEKCIVPCKLKSPS